MEIKEFLLKYLPDYDEKYIKFMKLIQQATSLTQAEKNNEFYNYYHHQALENYTNIICEKQREKCAETFDNHVTVLDEDFHYYKEYYNSILNAPQPNIEEL